MTKELLGESTQQKTSELPPIEWGEAEAARLLKMHPRDVSKWWDLVVHAIRSTTPEATPTSINQMLALVINGSCHCWVLYDRDSISGFVFTAPSVDPITAETSLYLYQIYSFKDISFAVLRLIFEQLKKYAGAQNISRIVCFTSNKDVVDVFSDLGANTKTTKVVLEV